MRVAVEGLDGVGKTTVSKCIAEILDYKYVTKPFEFMFSNLDFDADQIKKIEWKMYETYDEALITAFYGVGLLYATRDLDDNNIIFDRHLGSNYYWHGNEETESLHKELIRLCGRPDLTIVLKASTETRIKRIKKRDKKDKDLCNCAIYEDEYNKIIDFLNKNEFNYSVVDTENKNIKDVVLESLYYINELQKNNGRNKTK